MPNELYVKLRDDCFEGIGNLEIAELRELVAQAFSDEKQPAASIALSQALYELKDGDATKLASFVDAITENWRGLPENCSYQDPSHIAALVGDILNDAGLPIKTRDEFRKKIEEQIILATPSEIDSELKKTNARALVYLFRLSADTTLAFLGNEPGPKSSVQTGAVHGKSITRTFTQEQLLGYANTVEKIAARAEEKGWAMSPLRDELKDLKASIAGPDQAKL